MHSSFNPYIAGDPVGKTSAFVGREDVLREVLRVLRHPQQNAVVLYGQRRIGKTSILQWLEAHLPEEGPYRPVYLDLMNYSGQPLVALLQDLARGIARALGQPRPVLEGDVRESFREQFIPQMLDALPEATALVLLMDEFDVQADPDADREIKRAFFSYMRALRQVAPQRLQFVFVLGRTIDDLDIVARGLFKDLPSKRVSLLSRKDTEALIRLAEQQGSLRWTHPAVEAIWDLTRGHPYLVQALCYEVWETLHEGWEGEGIPKAHKAHVEAAVEPVLERSAHIFAWIWEDLGPAEKVAAAALAEAGRGPVSEDRLEAILTENGVRILIRELRDAPRQLQAWDILEKVEGGYRFRVELLRRWIAEHHPLDRTQDELDRINPVADNLYQAGRGLYEGGDLEGARDTLERALGLNPSHQGALELLGEIALAQGDLDAAQKALEALLELSPRRARERLVQVYFRRAEATTDDREQEQWYRRALEVWPENRQAREALQALEAARAPEEEWINSLYVDKIIRTKDFFRILSRVDTQRGIWITGAPQIGKSTLLELLKDKLEEEGSTVVHLNGQQLGEWFDKLGSSPVDTMYSIIIGLMEAREKDRSDAHRRFILVEEFDRYLDKKYRDKVEALITSWRILYRDGVWIIVFSYKTYRELRELVDGSLVDFLAPFTVSLWDKEQIRNALTEWGIPGHHISKEIVSMLQFISGGLPVLVKESVRIWEEMVQERRVSSTTSTEELQNQIIEELKAADIIQNIWNGLSEECQLALLYLVWKKELRCAFQGHRILLMEFERIVHEIFPSLDKGIEKLAELGMIRDEEIQSVFLAEILRESKWSMDWNSLERELEVGSILLDVQRYIYKQILDYSKVSVLHRINLKMLEAYLRSIIDFPPLSINLTPIDKRDSLKNVGSTVFGFLLLILVIVGLLYTFGGW